MHFKRILFSLLFTLFGAILALQIKAVSADNSGNPVTAPISSPITITPTPTDTPTPTPVSTSGGSNNSSDNHNSDNHNDNSSHGSSSSSVCGNAKPTSAPQIIAAIATAPKQITIFFTKAGDPVDHYMISYGTKPNLLQYGNTNIGGANITKFTVGSLSLNTRYYFKIAGVNGCMPGDFSNEVSTVASSHYVFIPSNSTFAVMGAGATNTDSDNKKTKTENRIALSAQKVSHGFFGSIFNFFFHK